MTILHEEKSVEGPIIPNKKLSVKKRESKVEVILYIKYSFSPNIREPNKRHWNYQEVTDLTKEFMSFEWNNREVQRYNLIQHFTPSIFWHYVSNQFFPLKTYEIAQNLQDHFDNEIRNKLLNKEITNKDLMSLYNLDCFKSRISMCKEKFITDQLLRTSIVPVIDENQNIAKFENSQSEDLKAKNDPNDIDGMISFLESYLQKIKTKNTTIIHDLSNKLQKSYDPVSRREFEDAQWSEGKETGVIPEGIKLWNLNNIHDFNNSIYFDVAAIYLEDCAKNLKDYISDPKDLLIDSQYATKIEEEYLRYVAQKHQEK